MPVDYFKYKEKQKVLLFILIGVVLLIVIVLGRGFLAKEQPVVPSPVSPVPKKIEVNTDILQDYRLTELQPFERIVPLTEEEGIGRENPFVPY